MIANRLLILYKYINERYIRGNHKEYSNEKKSRKWYN